MMELEISTTSRLLKKTHILRCARSSRYNVLAKYASARRFFARLGSEIFLISLQPGFFIILLGSERSSISRSNAVRRWESITRTACAISFFYIRRRR
jgi:hypothetical protein